jgi:hypothetical protein
LAVQTVFIDLDQHGGRVKNGAVPNRFPFDFGIEAKGRLAGNGQPEVD